MPDHLDRTLTVRLADVASRGEDLRLDEFLEQLGTLRTALRETERVITGREPALYFKIKSLRKDSPALVVLEAVSDVTDERSLPQFASKVVRSLTANLRIISLKKRVPRSVDVPTLEAYRELTIPAERHGLEVQIRTGNNKVLINKDFRETLESVIGNDEFSYGSLSGKIERMNLHNKNLFFLYPAVGASRVKGRFRSRDRRRFTLAMDRYVTVYGQLRYKPWDKYPYGILADDLVIHDTDVPTLNEVKGICPEATGPFTTQEYIDQLRDEQ